MQKSEFGTTPQLTSNSPISRRVNPYVQLIERLRKGEKTQFKNSDARIDHPPSDSLQRKTSLQTDTDTHIQKFLSFLHSLDDPTSNKQTSDTFDENTLTTLFSVDNHLSSSIDVPTNIHQLNTIPKSILRSLKNTSDNEQILNKVKNY
jgi:hypothetical protein